MQLSSQQQGPPLLDSRWVIHTACRILFEQNILLNELFHTTCYTAVTILQCPEWESALRAAPTPGQNPRLWWLLTPHPCCQYWCWWLCGKTVSVKWRVMCRVGSMTLLTGRVTEWCCGCCQPLHATVVRGSRILSQSWHHSLQHSTTVCDTGVGSWQCCTHQVDRLQPCSPAWSLWHHSQRYPVSLLNFLSSTHIMSVCLYVRVLTYNLVMSATVTSKFSG